MPQGIDLVKRKRVMARSKALGHCICDVKRQCPCGIFVDQGICPCAGERPSPVTASQIKLTGLSSNAGCASKISASDLEGLLSRLPQTNDPAVISGLAAADDAGVYKINSTTTLVQTVDVFTPCVDDPYIFGKICAANCLSDIYAMGGVPRTALSVLAFPSETLDKEIMFLMLKGAMEVLNSANCALLGGHSIKDQEIKLGFAITGTIDASKVVSLETARPGDVLVLTKPLGTGVLTFAHQIGRAPAAGSKAAEESMMRLNKAASEVMVQVGVSACTDITGFGLFGHLLRMMRHSGTSACIYADAVPVFEGVLDLLRAGVVPGAVERNAEFVGGALWAADNVAEEYRHLGLGAETSGGLMIAVPVERLQRLVDVLGAHGVMPAVIGEVFQTGDQAIELIMSKDKGSMGMHKDNKEARHDAGCCSAVPAGDCRSSMDTPSTVPASMKAFGDMVSVITASGKVDKRVKELIIFSLVLMQRCEACISMHYDKSLAMGITKEELDEAAWCSALIGGAPVKMSYAKFLESRRNKES